MTKKENPREFVIELSGWTLKYSFWVTDKRQRHRSGPYFDFLNVELAGSIIVPSSKLYAEARITMGHDDEYGEPIETEDPHPIIGHVHYKKPVLEGRFRVPQRMIGLLVHAIDRSATRYLYVHSDQLKRNKAYVRSVHFEHAIDLELSAGIAGCKPRIHSAVLCSKHCRPTLSGLNLSYILPAPMNATKSKKTNPSTIE